MRFRCESDGAVVEVDTDQPIGQGGEAIVCPVLGQPGLLAKIYHIPTPQRASKLRAMIANPPDDPMAAQGHTSIAWPREVLWGGGSKACLLGFLMPRVQKMRPLIHFYNPSFRRRAFPQFDYRYLHRMARNLSAAVGAIHKRGYVIGDVNESNVLGIDRAVVTLVDTDSFQVPDPKSGGLFRCPVGKPEFTPPELQGKSFDGVDRAEHHDLFGLGVLIFQLLMEGTHPFEGVFIGRGDPPPYEVRISQGHFPHASSGGVPYRPKPFAVPFGVLPPPLQALFVRCFVQGHRNPAARPDAQTWRAAIDAAEQRLATCSASRHHLYGDHLVDCPWCRRATLLGGRDPFPPRGAATPPVVRRRPRPTAAPAPRPIPAPARQPARRPATASPARKVLYIGFLLAILLAGGLGLSKLGTRSQPGIAQETVPVSLGANNELTFDLAPGVTMRCAPVPAGKFLMGSPEGEKDAGKDEMPQHEVTITKAFYMGATQVTQAQYEAVMGKNPSSFKGPQNPVEWVSWDDAVEFCKKLSEKTGKKVRLPTEAEWEYACRAGTKTRFSFGDDDTDLRDYAWYTANSENKTHPVGEKKPNAWGLYDMHGNVRQWCSDYLGESYANAKNVDPQGPASGSYRVLRGGCWVRNPEYCRSAGRFGRDPGDRYDYYGFRVVLDLK